MKRTLTLVIVLALALLVAVTPVLAGGDKNRGEVGTGTVEQNQVSWDEYESSRHVENQEQVQTQTQVQTKARVRARLGPSRAWLSLTGTVTALDGSITVDVTSANRLTKEYIGGQPTVQVSRDTYYQLHTEDGPVVTGCQDLEVGDTVVIRGILRVDVLTATRVIVDRSGVPEAF